LEHIRVTTEKLIQQLRGIKQPQAEKNLKGVLRKNFTKQEQRHIKSYIFAPSRLVLNIDSSAWLYQLNFKREKLFKDLNRCLKPREKAIEVYLQLDRNETKTKIKTQ
jgi:hypothetical protein